MKNRLALLMAVVTAISSAGCSPQTKQNNVALSSPTQSTVQQSVSNASKENSTDKSITIDAIELTVGEAVMISPTFKGLKRQDVNYQITSGFDSVELNGAYVSAIKKGVAVIRAELASDSSVYTTFSVNVSGKDGYYKINDYLYASRKGGVYEDAFYLELAPSLEDYKIYYTLDSTTPTTDSIPYEEAISITDRTQSHISNYPLTTSVIGDTTGTQGSNKLYSQGYYDRIEKNGNYPKISLGTVITVGVFDSDGNLLDSTGLTYIIKDNPQEYFSVPVVCVSMPYEEWFGSEGIYNDIYGDEKCRANLEYYDLQTGENFTRNTQVKLGGGWSRGLPQRTLHLNFNKDEYGYKNKPVGVSIFGDHVKDGDEDSLLSGFTRFRLHNGGNNNEASTHFNDALLQRVAEGTNVSTTSYRPCIVYLNGEYWGYYAMREHYSDTYFADNYGVDKDDVFYYDMAGDLVLEDGDEELAPKALQELKDYFNNNDFTDNAVYEYCINNLVDKDSFIDCMIFESYAHNFDHVGNNNNFRMWRTIKKDNGNKYYDGKWRAGLHDVDFAFLNLTGNYMVPYKYFNNGHNSTPASDMAYDKFWLYSKLLENVNFRRDLCERATELLSTNLSPDNVIKEMREMADEIEPLLDDQLKRWGSYYSISDWKNGLNNAEHVIKNRPTYYLTTLYSILNYYEDNTLEDTYCVDSYYTNDRIFSPNVSVGTNDFTLEYYASYSMFNPNGGTECRCGLVLVYDDNKEVRIIWDPSYWGNIWAENANFSGYADYLNVGTHKFKIDYQKGKFKITVDDYFNFEFTADVGSKNVKNVKFFTVFTTGYFNRVKIEK